MNTLKENKIRKNSSKLTKEDLMITAILAIVVGLLSCSILGFFAEGFDAPISYYALDDFSIISQIKQLTQENWLWSTDRMGAPYGQQVFDYTSFFLQNFEYLMIKFWTLFTDSVPVVVNLQYLFTFILCAVLAYLVLRKMAINYFLAICGAVLYAYTPYLFGRGIGHYCLTACYFVPVSIYLCYLTYIDDDFLKFDKSIFSYKTILVLLGCACIANNGIGYYPFFTCFFLCVSALCKLLERKKIKAILPQIKVIICIIFFMVISLLPTFIYHMKNGTNDIAVRPVGETEIYSLKIAQLFIPMYTHGTGWVYDMINEYNQNMPLVNENSMAYLGVVGCLGFLLGILCIFVINKNNDENTSEIFLLSRLNLASVLFMSIGGFISLLAVISQIYVMRGFNRISIFIMFCSLALLCFVAQKLLSRIEKQQLKWPFYVVVGCITLFGIWNQTPWLYNEGGTLRMNREAWNRDASFIQQIEDEMSDEDMIFQLPYHKYPEHGPVNNMTDYQLLTGYIHSDTLRWNFGGIKGRKGDRWNEYVSQLEIREMINTLVSSGFRGIYIDKRAYVEEELSLLTADIENVIAVKPLESADANILFYNLYPYISANPELLNNKPLTIEDIESLSYSYGEEIVFAKEGYNASPYIGQGMSAAEDGFSWTLGDCVDFNLKIDDATEGEAFSALIEIGSVYPDSQHVIILVNDMVVSEQDVCSGEKICFDGIAGKNGCVNIQLQLPGCVSPKELGESEDSRQLALQIIKMTIER